MRDTSPRTALARTVHQPFYHHTHRARTTSTRARRIRRPARSTPSARADRARHLHPPRARLHRASRRASSPRDHPRKIYRRVSLSVRVRRATPTRRGVYRSNETCLAEAAARDRARAVDGRRLNAPRAMCGGVERLNDDVFARGSAARSAPTPARVRVRTTTVALVFKFLAWVSENTRVRS